jgi:hypothetical protein
MRRSILLTFALLVSVVTLAFAADITGRWQGKITMQDGNEFELVYTFKVDGETLTGALSTPNGDLPISDGKVKGDEFSFSLTFGDNTIPMKGKVDGDTLRITSQGMDGQERVLVLTRAPAKE